MKSKKGAKVKEPKDGRIKKLEAQVRRLKKDKNDLITKLNTLEAGFQKNIKFLKGSVEDLSVEDLIEAAKEDKSLKEVKDEVIKCPNCEADIRPIATRFGKVVACKCGHRGKLED